MKRKRFSEGQISGILSAAQTGNIRELCWLHKIVIAPERWFADASIDTSDLLPASWVKL